MSVFRKRWFRQLLVEGELILIEKEYSDRSKTFDNVYKVMVDKFKGEVVKKYRTEYQRDSYFENERFCRETAKQLIELAKQENGTGKSN